MANVSKIVLPDGTECNIKDKTARELLLNTSKIITGTCSADAGQTALAVTIPNYTLADKDIIAITFANDVPEGASLNINNAGAKAIQVGGTSIQSNIIKAKNTALFLYDTSMQLLTTSSVVADVGGHTVKADVPADAKFTDHTYSIMTGATASANGKYGLVPSPAAGRQNYFLRGDGTWAHVTASDCLPLAGGTMTGTIKSNAQYPLIINDGDSKTYGFPLRVNKSDGTAMCNIATQHTDALNALLFQIYEPNDSSKYAYFNIYADPSTGYRIATNCTMPKNYTAGTVLYGNKATTVTLNYKPSAVLLYCEAVNTGGWAVMGLNASHLTSTGFTIPAGEADNSSVYCFALKGGSYSPFLGSTVHYVAFK